MTLYAHLAWSILNSVWQSGVIAAVAAVVLRCCRRTTAAARYAVWAAVLVATALLPAINAAIPQRIVVLAPAYVVAPTALVVTPAFVEQAQAAGTTSRVPVAASKAAVSSVARTVADDASHLKVASTSLARTAPTDPPTVERLWSSFSTRSSGAIAATGFDAVAAGDWLRDRSNVIVIGWFAIASLLFLRLGLGVRRLRAVKRGVLEIDDPAIAASCSALARRVTVASSPDVDCPCLIGYTHPVVALPDALVRELEGDDLQRVLAHELGHARRYDDWANLIQQCIRAALFFNPVVHAACRALDVDREIACDDLVAAGHADRIEYAKCLTEIARRSTFAEHLVPAAGFFPDRRQIVVRIEQLLDREHAGSPRVGVAPAASAVVVVVAVTALAAHQLPAYAVSSAPPPAPAIASHALPAVAPIALRGPVLARVRRLALPAPARRAMSSARPSLIAPPPAVRPTVFGVAARGSIAAARQMMVAARALAVREAPRARIASDAMPAIRLAPMEIAQVPLVAPRAAVLEIAASSSTSGGAAGATSADDFLDALQQAGYTHLSIDDLIAVRNAGVSSAYLHALKQAGIAPMSAKDLIALSNAGVTPDLLAVVHGAGYTSLDANDLIALADAGVTSRFIAGMKDSGRPRASVQDLIALTNAGVTTDYIAALDHDGYAKLSVKSIIGLANAGVAASYLGDMSKLGYAGMSVDTLTALANAGVQPSYVRALDDLGYGDVSTTDLIRMMNAGVTPKLIEELRAHGYTSKLSVDELIKLANDGF